MMSKRQKTNEGEGTSGRQPDVVHVSKAMSKLLRHSPPEGTMDSEGWMDLPVLLQHLKGHPSEALVRMAVTSNDKQRFLIDDNADPPRIRATQGHSVKLDNPVLLKVSSAQHLTELLGQDPSHAPPFIAHLTGEDGWAAIQATGELRRMNRTHIHFATRPHMIRKNTWAKVWLKLDLVGAMEAGHDFHLSTNDVLLAEGPLPLSFVKRINKMDDLPQEWRMGELS